MSNNNLDNQDKTGIEDLEKSPKYQLKELVSGEESAKKTISQHMSQSLIDEYGTPPDQKNIDDLLDYYYARDDSVIFYLEEDNEIAGFTWLIESADVILGNSFVCILYLYVNEKYRGRKYSKILLNKSIEYCKEKNIDDVRLTVRVENPIAIKLYNSLGFKLFKHEMSLKLDIDKKND